MAFSRSRTAAAVVLIVALVLGVGSRVVFATEADALASITTLTLVNGEVLIRHGNGNFVLAQEGDVLAAGDTIRTGTAAYAEITYFEGSSVRLDAETELTVEALTTEADGGAVSRMTQTLERTWHSVTKLITGGTRYEVRAPSSTASVRG